MKRNIERGHTTLLGNRRNRLEMLLGSVRGITDRDRAALLEAYDRQNGEGRPT